MSPHPKERPPTPDPNVTPGDLLKDDAAAQNQRSLRRLVLSIEASPQRLNLLIAICDNWQYRDELIRTYEAELTAKGIRCYRTRLERSHPSLKHSLQALMAAHPDLQAGEESGLVTVLGADELLGIALEQAKSAQEQFFFSVQWTRESLRDFAFPLVLWLTPAIATGLAQQAPDFWSWRGGVFEFSRPLLPARMVPLETTASLPPTPEPEVTAGVADPDELVAQIAELTALSPESPLLPSLYHSLGQAYEAAIRYADAETAYRQALALRQHHFGNAHPEVAASLNALAGSYYDQGRYREAEPLYQQALEIRRSQLGSEHPDTATSLNNLAFLYQAQGRYGEAEPLHLQALEIRRSQLGAEHPDTATSLNNLAGLYESQGRYGEAEPLYRQALEIQRSQLGAEHPATATTSLNNLAELYRAQGRYGEAEPLHLQALEIRRSQLGSEHPDTATSLNNLAALYRAQGRYGEAEPLYLQALEITRSQLGSEHPDTATSLNNLAFLYQAQGRYGEAEPLYLEALSIALQRLGETHPTTQTIRDNFERCVAAALEAGQAESLSDDPNTQEVLAQLRQSP